MFDDKNLQQFMSAFNQESAQRVKKHILERQKQGPVDASTLTQEIAELSEENEALEDKIDLWERKIILNQEKIQALNFLKKQKA